MMKKFAWKMAAVLLALSLAGCQNAETGTANVENVGEICGIGPVGLIDRFAGMVVSEEETKIEKSNTVQIAEILVKAGDTVEEGQTLFTYDNTQLEFSIERAKLELEQMKLNLQSKIQSKEELEKEKEKAKESEQLAYSLEMRRVLEAQEHLTIKQAEVCSLLWEDVNNDTCVNSDTVSRKIVTGVVTGTGATYHAKAVVLCTGVYLNARCLTGESITYTGPNGLMAATHLSDSLREMGIELRRFKTGTPARMDGKSIDFSKMVEQPGDERIVPFSFSTDPDSIQKEQVSCWLTYTNEETHQVIRENIHRSPIYAGIIEGVGPRYCPSIEDKVVKFPDRERHQVFLEPEGLYTDEMYVDGMSSSLPEEVQLRMYRTVPGLEHCRIVRNAYAIEYDCISARQLYPSLEFKAVKGLFAGGQFNGSSGYEEAAAQGFVAGVNAAMEILGKDPLILTRDESYIGVLIDDLVTKDNKEPYRMMTSRAEYRLLLRQDNADLRLRKYGYRIGLVSREILEATEEMDRQIHEEMDRLRSISLGANAKVQDLLEQLGTTSLKTAATLADLLCRPELHYDDLAVFDPDRPTLSNRVKEQVEIEIKYEGYIARQKKQVEQFRKMENRKIPVDLDYDEVPSLRIEARSKLKEYHPISIGQASRISGVTPADVSVLLIYLERRS